MQRATNFIRTFVCVFFVGFGLIFVICVGSYYIPTCFGIFAMEYFAVCGGHGYCIGENNWYVRDTFEGILLTLC